MTKRNQNKKNEAAFGKETRRLDGSGHFSFVLY